MDQIGARSFLVVESPIKLLPEPVLSSVFLLAYWDWEGLGNQFSVRSPLGTHALASVCRQWRSVALSTPQLWTLIDASHSIEHLVTHLERSGNQPIDVSLAVHRNRHMQHEFQFVDFHQVLSEISKKAHWCRLRNLNIYITQYCDVKDAIRPEVALTIVQLLNNAVEANPFTNLGELWVHITPDQDIGEDRDNGYQAPCLYLPYSSAIRSVSFEGIRLSLLPQVSRNPLTQLQYLTLMSMNLSLSDLLLPLLKVASNLVEVFIGRCQFYWGTDDQIQFPDNSILLSKLKIFKIENVDSLLDLNNVFYALDMTSLQTFELLGTDNLESSGEPVNWEAICRYRTVEDITLEGIPPGGMDNLLSHINKLERLQEFMLLTKQDHVPNGFVKGLVRKLLETSCCPMLKRLYIHFPLDGEAREMIEDLKEARDELKIWIDLEDMYDDHENHFEDSDEVDDYEEGDDDNGSHDKGW